jgi:hypothetical protein
MLIYAQHYGVYWFSLTIDEWRECLRTGIAGESHMMPKYSALQRRPKHIRCEGVPGSPQASFWSTRDDVLLYSPLDWEIDDYKDALEELNDHCNRTTNKR